MQQAGPAAALALVVLGSTACAATPTDAPAFLAHRSDAVQRVFADVVLGYAFEQKCTHLTSSARDGYERELNGASRVFAGYTMAKEWVSSAAEASAYQEEMVLSASNYAGGQPCNAQSEARVDAGLDAAENFMSLVDGEMSKPLVVD